MHEEFEALCGPARLPDLGRRLERAQRRERGLGEAGVREVVDEQVEELHVRLLQLGDDRIDCLARLVDRGPDRDHHHLVLDPAVAHLERRERREENLPRGATSDLTLPYLTLPHLTLPYPTLPHLTFPYLSSPYLTLLHLTLPYLT